MSHSSRTPALVLAAGLLASGPPTAGGADPVREERTMVIRLHATADRVFPLFGPIRESEWDSHWAPRMVFPTDRSQSEKGAVFTVGDSVWVRSTYDPGLRTVRYVRVLPGVTVTVTEIDIAVAQGAPATPAMSEVRVTYRLTSLSPAGQGPLERFGREFPRKAGQWEEAINHLLLTGQTLERHHP